MYKKGTNHRSQYSASRRKLLIAVVSSGNGKIENMQVKIINNENKTSAQNMSGVVTGGIVGKTQEVEIERCYNANAFEHNYHPHLNLYFWLDFEVQLLQFFHCLCNLKH